MSLRRRVLLGFLLVALALVVTNVALASAFEDDLVEQTDQELLDTANRPIFTRGGRGPHGGPGDLQPLSDLYIAASNRDGTGLTRLGQSLDEGQSPPAPTVEQLVDRPGVPFTTSSLDGGSSWRAVAIPGRIDGLLVVATDLDQVEATLRRMWLIQLVGSVAVLAALAAVLWWVLRLGVRPLVAMAATADEIAAGDLSRRVDAGDDRTEAGRLGLAFNAMLSEIEEAFREREASEARLRRFAADASHELRTPLTSIRGYADLWRAGGLRDPGQLDQAMRRLSDEGHRMSTLVEDLLLLARLDQQRPVERQPVRLDHLAADAVSDALAVEPDRPITLEAAPVTVLGDEQRLRQVVANLVANARLHTPAGTPVHVEVGVDGPTAHLVVADRGPGIPPSVVEHVFERFYRGDSSRVRTTGGSGLGLSIVEAIARAHGGRASAASTEGEGSRFTVELPVVAGDHQPPHSDVKGGGPTLDP
jgi:two-component system OmpR family sensor kinase